MLLYIILIIALLASILWFMGNYTFWLPSQPANYPRILMLHRVTKQTPASGMNVPPTKFEQLLQILQKQGYQSHFVSELPTKPIDEEKWVCITFDDGFLDNYTEAFPLLQQYRMKATIYLATHIQDIKKLDKQAIQTMQASGLIEFGAHTQDHVNLLKLTDEEALHQITQSKQDVINLVGYCSTFAYPFGRFNHHHETMVKQAGFTTAVSTRKKIQAVNDENIFSLPRISINGTMNTLQLLIALAKGRYKL